MLKLNHYNDVYSLINITATQQIVKKQTQLKGGKDNLMQREKRPKQIDLQTDRWTDRQTKIISTANMPEYRRQARITFNTF